MAVVAELEWLHQDDIGVNMVGECEEIFATSGANWEPVHVISVNFADGFGFSVDHL